MLAPLGCFFCVKNDNKNRQLDKLIQSYSDLFHILLLGKKLSKSIFKIAPNINKYLRNVFSNQTIQDIVKF